MNMLKSLFSGEDAALVRELKAKVEALDKSQAVIEFNLDGTIITANANFLSAMGYQLNEIQNQHHRMFVDSEYGNSAEYREFWDTLSRGIFQSGEFKRVHRNGNDVWIQASYNPVMDENGRPYKVIKYATDITAQKHKTSDYEGQLEAIGKAQAVIEFNLDGTIIHANENFLAVTGYRLDEVKGQHHRMFVGQEYANSIEYKNFWDQLAQGKYDSGEYQRFSKNGDSVWIQASYNPIFDQSGKPFKVVKYATDITEQKNQAVTNLKNSNIASALKIAQTNVMLADNNMTITYMNDQLVEALTAREKELKEALPAFSVNTLIGTNVDVFHKNPDHQRSMIASLTQPFKTQIKAGEIIFSLIASPWKNEAGERLGTVIEWEDITDELAKQEADKVIANANARVKQALDVVSNNAMIADNDFNIVYMNAAVKNMMANAEADIRTDIPGFDASRLEGQNIDIFHKNPAHQRHMVKALDKQYNTKIKVGGRTFSLIANPIFNDANERIGTIVEWQDLTAEVFAEQEIDQIVEAAAMGDLSRRISVDGKDGFFLNLAEGLNKLLTIADSVISDTIRVFDALAHGNLTRRIDEDYQGAFDKLKQDANSTVDRLTDIITRIRDSASTVATGANEIAQGNADLSKRTESQASSLEETASSMEEMTSAVKQTGDNSVHANDLATSAKQKAQSGGDVVSKAVDAMDEINHSSKKIADIIGVIDEIAFQTNLLALNAAVEAARAGEQGRGFAVVAGEVRNLAQRSAGAAKEIKDLIRDSVDKVDAGTALVNESGKTLNDIIQSVDRVSDMIQEISTAAREQSSGIDQVNAAVAQMDEMTQQNAALVEEASAAGEAMAEQAQSMMQMMEFFSVDANAPTSMTDMSVAIPAPGTVSSVPNMAVVQSAAPAPASNTPAGGLSFSDDDDEWAEF
ncbi:methyl-accepting chemotaxis protein [Bacterioplanoides sp.]|uniref:methyl-accepting chemotaxis protein n=1 Tax=Bacterioplanoides sp. TaxID=2066072 RepID=UPI003B009B3C